MSLLLILLALAVAVVLLLAAAKPGEFRVERALRIQAPPEALFAAINDLHRWPEWSPWERLDPAMRRSYDGAPAGVGASYAWDGNNKAGAGRMQITESDPYNRIELRLDFLRPFTSCNRVEFTLQPVAELTELRWSMTGPLPFVAKIMHVFVNMDAMIGRDFEAGLARLRALAERRPG
jgi:uncharacterized protein YndB with AHSA1/START domain